MDFEYEVSLAIQGNKEAFSRLIKHYEGSLYRVSKTILQSDSDCADAIQDTILRAYNGVRNLNQPEYFKTWLIRILINECNRISIQNKKIIPMEDVIACESQNGFEERVTIRETINSLEEDLRETVILYYMEDLSVKDVSKAQEIPEGTVKSRLSRARKKLTVMLDDYYKGSESNERKIIG